MSSDVLKTAASGRAVMSLRSTIGTFNSTQGTVLELCLWYTRLSQISAKTVAKARLQHRRNVFSGVENEWSSDLGTNPLRVLFAAIGSVR